MARPYTAQATHSVLDFIGDQNLLGAYFAGRSWDRWRAVLRAAFALPMSDRDLTLFREVAERDPPTRPVSELVAVVGRGGGKDSIASALAAFIAVTNNFSRLRPGEKGTVLCVANDRDQAAIAMDYVRGYFDQVPLLKPLVRRATPDTIDLKNGARIMVGTNSIRGVRGRTLCCAIYDEVAFWRSEDAANPDIEVDNAISPGLMRVRGSLKILISTPYRRAGLLYERYKAAYGTDDPDTLVVLGGSTMFNDTLDDKAIDRELAKDYELAASEYLCKWRDDISAFIDRDAVMATVDAGCRERPHEPNKQYVAFVDPSGGRDDAFTLGIAHSEGDRVILDLVREVRPPLSPTAVAREYATTAKTYRVGRITGDNYAAGFNVDAFREAGLAYEISKMPRSDIYRELLPLINSGRVSLLDNDRMINQLCALERRVSPSGKDQINHPDRGHDDVINAAAGALVLAAERKPMEIPDALLARARLPGRHSYGGTSTIYDNALQTARSRAFAANASPPTTFVGSASDFAASFKGK